MIYAPQSSPALRWLPAWVTALSVAAAAPATAQNQGEISADTRLRREPDGTPLVSLPAGAEVEARGSRGDWHEVVVEGWIFSSSTGPTDRDGFDLVVRAQDGENLRESPNGEVVGRVRAGTLLRKLETRGGWTHVSRKGWVPKEALNAPAQPDTPAVAQAPASSIPTTGQSAPGAPSSALAVPQPTRSAAYPDRAAVARETPMFATPQGGPYGTLQTGAPARILGRSGEWVRVAIEGWVRESDIEAASGGALTGITADEIRSDPTRYLGKTIEWRLQLIAVQTADELRNEMPRGQKYLLTRGPLPEPGFVYVTVTENQAAEFRALPALQEMTLRVNVKAARTKYLTTPVVELVGRVE